MQTNLDITNFVTLIPEKLLIQITTYRYEELVRTRKNWGGKRSVGRGPVYDEENSIKEELLGASDNLIRIYRSQIKFHAI